MSVIREICTDVVVLEAGRVAEAGPVWRVFGAPEHEATKALLAPLTRNLPEDLAARLTPQPGPGGQAVLRITYSGRSAPDLAALVAATGGDVRLLQASVERIQGHAVGRVLIAATNPEPRRACARSGKRSRDRLCRRR